jgi:DNA-binding NarL/FixJ family response regulator
MTSQGAGSRPLTQRQLQVLALMAEGHSNQAISHMLFISEKAVVQHTSQIYARLDLHANDDDHRRVKAVLRYLGA